MSLVTIINLTPHTVVIAANGTRRELPPSGRVARAITKAATDAGTLETVGGNIPLATVDMSAAIVGLPEPTDGVVYLVSTLVAAQVQRPDVVVPYDQERDEHGRVISCSRLARIGSKP